VSGLGDSRKPAVITELGTFRVQYSGDVAFTKYGGVAEM
jgi:hypothetical protein